MILRPTALVAMLHKQKIARIGLSWFSCSAIILDTGSEFYNEDTIISERL